MDNGTLEKILEKLANIEAKFQADNENMQKQMRLQFEQVNANIDKKLDSYLKKLEIVETKVEEIAKKVQSMEREKTRRNLVIFGVQQEEGENYKNLEEKVLKIVRENMEIQIQETEIDFIRRFGKGENKNPIMLGLTTWRRKMQIITSGRKLKNTGWAVDEDYPLEVQAIRKQLYPKMKAERAKGKKAFLKYDQLIVSDTNKRKASESPEIDTQTKVKPPRNKKNKIKPHTLTQTKLNIGMFGKQGPSDGN
uniref:Endonuclease-reverse transcriptase n=2 Tax=Cacopsylla melanoneura TaxID=428564 RepID=A0A8D8YTI4_9HEMI